MNTKRTKLELEEVYADVEEHLIRLRQEGRVKAALVKKYQVHPATAGKWIAEVFARFKASSKNSPEVREARRDLMRATLDTVASMAFNKSVTMRHPDGRPMLDANGKPIKTGAPDLRSVLDACKQLRELDALDEPIKIETTNNGTTTTTLVIAEDARKSLEKALKGLA
jgi:hypothetical protein